MKLICAIVVFGLSMLSDVIVLGVVTAVLFTLAVLLALPVLDELSEGPLVAAAKAELIAAKNSKAATAHWGGSKRLTDSSTKEVA